MESGKLWILQTRSGKRSARAAVKIAVDMAREGLVTKKEAVLRVEPMHVVQLLLPQFDERAKAEARRDGRRLARGLNASPGAAAGFAAFDPDEAELTRTRKLRRGFIEERYREMIEAMYGDGGDVRVRASVKYRDGRTGEIETAIRVCALEESE